MSRHSKVCMHPVVGPDVHCQWNIRHAFFRLLTRTWRSRPRPRPRTYLPRPRPRPRTCLTRPRPGPRTFILSSRTHQGQGQGLTTLGISVLLHRGSKCLLLQQMLCSITSPCQSAATFKTVNRCCSPVYSCKQRYSKYSEFYLYHCNFTGLLPFINRQTAAVHSINMVCPLSMTPSVRPLYVNAEECIYLLSLSDVDGLDFSACQSWMRNSSNYC